MSNSTIPTGRKVKWFRKSLVIPTEHGAWSWLLVPYFVGLIVAGQFNLQALLVLVGGLSAYFVRQPMTSWLRIRRGNGRRSDGPIAAGWTIGFGFVATLCLMGLLASGLTDLIWLTLPIIGLFIVYSAAARQKRSSTRTFGMELAGAAGLAAMAPAAYIASSGQLDSIAWALWALMAGQNGLGVIYVRLRIADTHQRSINRGLVVGLHIIALGGLTAAAAAGWIPWLALLPFSGYLLRALWAVAQVRPVTNIKRFGFTEIGVEILGGLIIALSWLI
jgi:hypothetical protein